MILLLQRSLCKETLCGSERRGGWQDFHSSFISLPALKNGISKVARPNCALIVKASSQSGLGGVCGDILKVVFEIRQAAFVLTGLQLNFWEMPCVLLGLQVGTASFDEQRNLCPVLPPPGGWGAGEAVSENGESVVLGGGAGSGVEGLPFLEVQ